MHKFFYYNHQDKGTPFAHVLQAGGWDTTRAPHDAHLVLADLEGFGRQRGLDLWHTRFSIPTVLYPHGTAASCTWNFPGVQTFPFVKTVCVPAVGWTQIMQSYNCQYQSLVTGWPFSGLSPFTRTTGRSILFAPIHPNSNGFLSKVDRQLNLTTFQRLCKLMPTYKLTVRYIGVNSDQSGIPIVDGVTYVSGEKSITDSLKFMADFDLIVSRHMFAYLAVATGKPTVMFGEFVAPHYGASNDKMVFATDWPLYKEVMKFPIDILVENDMFFMVERATYSDYEIEDWKTRMIGGPFNQQLFLAEMEKIVNGKANDSVSPSRGTQEAQEEGARQGEQKPQHEWPSSLQEGV